MEAFFELYMPQSTDIIYYQLINYSSLNIHVILKHPLPK